MSNKQPHGDHPVFNDVINKVLSKYSLDSNLNKVGREIRNSTPTYIQNGNYNLVLLFKGGALIGSGVAKRNPIDSDSPFIGRSIALSRAIRDAATRLLTFKDQ